MRFSVTVALLAAVMTCAAIALPASAGEIGDRCTFGVDEQCGEGKWCDPTPGSCGQAVQTGKCVRRRQACPRHFRPECGCNGATYSNACGRIWARQSMAHEGKCIDDPIDRKQPR